MKSLSLFALSTALFGLALIGCERHSFEDTKGLHLGHGHHDEDHGHHGEAGHAKDDHGKEAHAESKGEAKPEAAKEEPRKTGI